MEVTRNGFDIDSAAAMSGQGSSRGGNLGHGAFPAADGNRMITKQCFIGGAATLKL
jgi:hypothetical protein